MNVICIILLYLAWFLHGIDALRCFDNRRRAVNNSCSTDGVCFASIARTNDGRIKHTFGCNRNPVNLDGAGQPLTCLVRVQLRSTFNQKCCWDSDDCNKYLIVKLVSPTTTLPPAEQGITDQPLSYTVDPEMSTLGITELVFIIVVPLVLLVIFIFIVFLIYKRRVAALPHPYLRPSDDSHEAIIPGCIDDIMDMTSPSGSGCGVPLLVQRTVARQIQLQTVVGKGRFGVVWRGCWRSEHVAVKIFSSREEWSWFREAEIYQTVMLRHDNLLGFIAADNKDNGTCTQLWLVTEYHERGSLYDYLNTGTITVPTMVRMCLSIACGLQHLHMEIVGTQGKPAIAHRDIKSKNILVKTNGSCCIADLGLAVRYDSAKDTVDIDLRNTRLGTKRYMPPEVINESLNTGHFDAFKCADVYSVGLVFWEIARRCSIAGAHEEFQLPYYDLVPSDPSLDDMKRIVCVEKCRPVIPARLLLRDSMRGLCNLMKDCWYERAAARLTALRIKKTLDSILLRELARA